MFKRLVLTVQVIFALLLSTAVHSDILSSGPLPADQAFNLQVTVNADKELEFYWQIAPGYHLYQDQLRILNQNNLNLLSPNNLPTGITVVDPIVGDSVVYDNKLLIKLPWHDSINDEVLVHYQGCEVDGFCYEPINKLVHINKDNSVTISATALEEFPSLSKIDALAAKIKNSFLPLTLLVFFGLGFLLSFSPCVLPMIPLVVNLIVGPKKISTHRSFVLASSYVLGMASSYAAVGTLAGMLGASMQAWLQQPTILIVFSMLLIILALTQLDLIKITVPSFNHHLHRWGQRQLQGSIFGALMLGVIASLLVSPCITPPLIGVLTYIGQNGNPAVGGLTLFCLGLGMGAPLIIVALLSSVILPKAGRWMQIIKVLTALALIAMALWILHRVYEQVYVVTEENTAIATQKWQHIQTSKELHQYLDKAKQQQQYTLLEVYASWCTSCKKIELGVLTDPKVTDQLKDMMLLKIDLTQISDKENELLEQLHIFGPPAILFYDRFGNEEEDLRMVGAITTEELLHAINKLKHKSP